MPGKPLLYKVCVLSFLSYFWEQQEDSATMLAVTQET